LKMKNLAILTTTAALLAMLAQPQAAEAKHHTYRAVVPNYGYGYGAYGYNYPSYGGATVFPDGSFTNNGYSWNGADPAGGATGGFGNPAWGGATFYGRYPGRRYGRRY